MPVVLINPLNETPHNRGSAAPRLAALEGRTIALLDISKPGGSVFLDRLEQLLNQRYGATILRVTKPTFAKPAPPHVLEQLRRSAAGVIEALAD